MSDFAAEEGRHGNECDSEERDITRWQTHLDEVARRGRRRVDNMVAGGAAGALVLSINFVDELTTHPPASHANMLGAAWLALGLALLASLLSSWAQTEGADAAFHELDNVEDPGQLDSDWYESGWSEATPWLNVGAAFLLLLGIGLLLLFAWLNITR